VFAALSIFKVITSVAVTGVVGASAMFEVNAWAVSTGHVLLFQGYVDAASYYTEKHIKKTGY